jgi:C-terminal processing protease CtpA/Prc
MPRLIPFVLLLLCVAQAQDDNHSFRKLLQQNSAEAEQLYRQKEYNKAAALLEQLRHNPNFAQIEDERERVGVLYNLACNYSLSAEKEKALEALGEAVAAGYSNADNMRQDSDLDNIRGENQYNKLFAEVEARSKVQNTLWNSPALNTKYRPDLTEDEKTSGLSRLWSEAKYNFPFFDRLPGLDWDAAYLSYLPKVRASGSTLEYYRTLAEFYALLHDGHTSVGYPEEVRDDVLGYPPVSTRLIEGRVFIDTVRDPSLKQRGIVAGRELLTVDGVPVKDYGNNLVAPRISASTPQDLARRTYEASLLSGLKHSPVELTLRDAAGNVQKVMLPRLTGAETDKLPSAHWSRFEFKMLPGDIAYVALNSFSDDAVVKDFDAAFAEIHKSNALILDVRTNGGGSSNIGYDILGYLTDKPFLALEWSTRDYRPAFRAWGEAEKTYRGEPDLVSPHGANAYNKAVVVLTSAQTYSAAEDFVVAFDSMKRGKIIGEPTGGSTGQPLSFDLPGGGSARVCAKYDRYPDGTEFVGVGVQPNILVHPTISDFRAGRDTVLLAATEFLSHR